MLSVFPSLLIFGIFSPFLLRVAVGLFFLYTGWQHLREERTLLVEEFTRKLGALAPIFAGIIALFEIILGLAFTIGFGVQLAALLGAVFILKLLWFKSKNPVCAKHERITYLLLLIMTLSLLVTGAGAFAVDLPL